MNIVWSDEAVEDLQSLRAYLSKDSPKAAQAMALAVVSAIEIMLPDNPQIGRPGRVPGTRELVIPRTPFIAPYRVRAGALQVLRVYHGARRWPDQL
jgi:toxin ParE1/3/4